MMNDTEVFQRFNGAMCRLGLGARIEIRDDRVNLMEIWPGAGQGATLTLYDLPDDHPDVWCRDFLENQQLILLDGMKKTS
jgi:hypothetical protein